VGISSTFAPYLEPFGDFQRIRKEPFGGSGCTENNFLQAGR
jgi:hypothetical protein